MKRFLKSSFSIFLAITIIFSSAIIGLSEIDFSSAFAVKSKAVTSGTTGDCTWSLEGTVLTISGNGEMNTYNYYSTLPWGTTITEVVIEDGVTNISDYAFYKCKSLTSVTIGNGVKKIKSFAFKDCTKLASITISDSVKYIGEDAFYNTRYFNDEKNWSDEVLYIGKFLIKAKETIEGNYPIKEGTKTIADYAFLKCSKLTSVVIPGSVKYIGSHAIGFYGKYDPYTEDTDYYEYEDFIIIGENNSPAEKYAKLYDFDFVAINHSHITSPWITDKNATVYSPGKKHIECYICGQAVETETIAQLKCSKPKLKAVENSQFGVKITWSKVKGGDSYIVYRKTKNGSYSKIGTTKNAYYTDKKAKSGKRYYYIVKAVNEAGNSASSNAKSIYHLADPTLKTPSSTSKGIGLRWSKVTGASGYMVYRRTANGSYKRIATENGVSNVTFRDTTAKKGTKYYYKVKAYYSKTFSAYSNTKAITDKY